MDSLLWHDRLARAGGAPVRWVRGWARIVFIGATLLVLAASPSSYGPSARRAMARHLYLDTAPILWWFTGLSAFLTLVITRIVIATALSYGLSQYALEMLIRVLVLELIPLTAALFVAMRCTIPHGVVLASMRRARGAVSLAMDVLPRALAGLHATLTLAALSCVVALVIAYVAVYGFTSAGVPAYTHVFGHVFSPEVTLVFALKTVFFSLAVSLIPIASGLVDDGPATGSEGSAALRGLVRMFAVLLLLEAGCLAGDYA